VVDTGALVVLGGAAGFTGEIGFAGVAGSGSTGFTGEIGFAGVAGSGATGFTGEIGLAGVRRVAAVFTFEKPEDWTKLNPH